MVLSGQSIARFVRQQGTRILHVFPISGWKQPRSREGLPDPGFILFMEDVYFCLEVTSRC